MLIYIKYMYTVRTFNRDLLFYFSFLEEFEIPYLCFPSVTHTVAKKHTHEHTTL